MRIKKIILIIFIVITAIVIGIVVVVHSWTVTPYGRLDPRVAVLLKYSKWKNMDLFKEGRSIGEIRVFSKENTHLLAGKPEVVLEAEDFIIREKGRSLRVRIYTPKGKPPFPIVVYYHGGGWVIGDLDSHDSLCRNFAADIPAVVISVDYRLAPENPFPAAVEDAYAALKWAAQNAGSFKGDPERIAVAGASSGGNLAAVTALRARAKGPALSAQVLIYPATNLSDFNTESYRNFANGFYLTKKYMEKFRELYLPDKKTWKDARVSPLLAATLKRLPPSLVLTDGFDVLRDEGEAYADRMKAAGVSVTKKRYPGMIHGFIAMDRLIPTAKTAQLDCTEFLKEIFYK